MNKTSKRALEALEHAAPPSLGHHLLTIMKAVLASTPFCGGIASLMSDYIPSRRVKRLEDFARQVAEDLNAVMEAAQAERLETDEYAFIFERCFLGASQFPQEEKIRAFRAILVNSILPTDLRQDEQEYFLSLAERLSPLHLRMIRFMSDPAGYLVAAGISKNEIRGGFSTFFPVALPGVDLQVIKATFADLHTFGFTTTSPDIFHTMTSGQGLELLGDRLTPLAKSFASFCTSPTDAHRNPGLT